MERTDINGNSRKWERVREKEFKTGLVQDLNKENSKTAIEMLKDFEIGKNTTTKGKRAAGSLLRIRSSLRLLGKEIKGSYNSITREQLSKICDKKDSEDFAKNVKIIYGWMYRTRIIKENISDHIVVNDYNKGKPDWVYLEEDQMKQLINSANAGYRALITFLYDSGVRPQEAWKIRVLDFQDDFTVLNIPLKRKNGEKVSKTFERTIKLKLCSGLIKDYLKLMSLKDEDLLFTITQAGFNKYIRSLSKKLFGTKPTKARESPDKITATDIRHNSACYWHIRYPKDKDLMYRMGWKKYDKVYYYSEFLNLRDTIDDEDMITTEDKNKYEKELEQLRKQQEYFAKALQTLTPQPTPINVNGQQYVSSVSGLTVPIGDKPNFIPYEKKEN